MSRKTRKLIWSVPLIAAVAVAGALAIFMTIAPGGLLAHDEPYVPELTATKDGRTAIDLSWTDPSSSDVEITGYRIDRSKNGHLWMSLESVAGDVTEYRNTGVKAGETWFYRVFTMDPAGTGPVSKTANATTDPLTAPGKVVGLDAKETSNDPTKISLSWAAPGENGGTEITRYCIVVARTGATLPTPSATITPENSPIPAIPACKYDGPVSTEANIKAIEEAGPMAAGIIVVDAPRSGFDHMWLRADQEWQYRVFAVNKVGWSENETGVQTATTTDAKRPSEPTMLTAVPVVTADVNADIETFNVHLYWYWPTDDGGAALGGQSTDAITSFRVEVSKDGTNWDDAGTAPATNNIIEAVPPAPPATDNDGFDTEDDKTALFGVTVPTEPPDSATATNSLQFRHTGITAAHFTGTSITLYYRVYTETGMDDTQLRSRQPATFRLRVAMTSLDVIDLDAVMNGNQDPRESGDPVDLGIWSRVPMYKDDTNGGINFPAEGDDPGEIDLDWEPAADPPPGHIKPVSYRLDFSKDGMRWRQVEDYTNVADPRFTHGDLPTTGTPDSRTRHYRVLPILQMTGPASEAANTAAKLAVEPDKVDGLSLTPVDAGQIDLEWDEPDDDGSAAIKRYCISAWVDDTDQTVAAATAVNGDPANCTATWSLTTSSQLKAINTAKTGVIVVGADSTEYMHKGLTAKQTWNYQVVGVNAIGFSLAGAETEDADTPAAGKAAAPNGMTAEKAKNSSYTKASKKGVLLLWNAPADPAGAEVTSYRVYRKIMGTDDDFMPIAYSNTAAETYYTDEEIPLEDEVRYYQVAAINSAGEGAASTQVRYPLDPAHEHAALSTELTAPSGLTGAIGADSSTIELSWRAGDDADVHFVFGIQTPSYDVGSLVWETADASDSHTVNMMGKPSGSYMFFVIAGQTDDAGDTTWSAWTPGTVEYP